MNKQVAPTASASDKMTRLIKKPLRYLLKIYPGLLRDVSNKVKYGFSAPLYKERIWINPQRITRLVLREEIKRVTGGLSRDEASGYVINWEDVQETVPVIEDFRMQYCLQHWKGGLSWEDLGVYDYMLQTKKYGHQSREEIMARFRMLDQAFNEVKKDGRLKTRQELNPGNFRERGGILIHIGKDGKLFFGGNGFHRLAMAYVLNLQQIPACIGVVDKGAIPYLQTYRKREADSEQ